MTSAFSANFLHTPPPPHTHTHIFFKSRSCFETNLLCNQKFAALKHCFLFKTNAHCEAKSLLLLNKSQQFHSLCTRNIKRQFGNCRFFFYFFFGHKIGSNSLTANHQCWGYSKFLWVEISTHLIRLQLTCGRPKSFKTLRNHRQKSGLCHPTAERRKHVFSCYTRLWRQRFGTNMSCDIRVQGHYRGIILEFSL